MARVHQLRPGQVRRDALPEAESLYRDMLSGYDEYLKTSRCGSQAREGQLRLIRELREHSERYPWEWSFEDWDSWNTELVVSREVTAGTQRKYQGAIRSFLQYLEPREAFQIRVQTIAGRRIVQFLDGRDVLAHIYDREEKEPRARFNREQSRAFMRAIQKAITRASALPPVNGKPHRILLNLQRDLALFATFITTGMRCGSLIAMNTWSFQDNLKVPELGKYGHVFTEGKGSQGQGPKTIHVPIDEIRLAKILGWYEKDVRPYFLSTKNPNETAFFLAEGGHRISYQTIWARCKVHLVEAGLAGIGLSPHSFRHSKITNSGEAGYDLETVRRMANHVYGTTTQGYMGISDQFCQNQVDTHLRNQIEKAKAKPSQTNTPSTGKS